MSSSQPRQPRGVPTGGQWRATARPEGRIALTREPGPLTREPDPWVPVKILDIVDTREYEPGPDNRMHPVPDTGTLNQCDRCGRDHVVHAFIEDQHGQEHIVGTSCAFATGPLAKRFTNLVAATQRLKAMEGALALAEQYAAMEAAAVEALRSEFPGWDAVPLPGSDRVVWTTKDGLAHVSVWVHHSDLDEREATLRDLWLRERMLQDIGPPPTTRDIERLRNDVARTRARVVALRDTPGPEHPPLEQADTNTIRRSGTDPRTKKAAYTEADLAPHIGKTVTVAPASGKIVVGSLRSYGSPITGTLHSVWKDRDGNVLGFRLARTCDLWWAGRTVTVNEIEEFSSRSHGSVVVRGAWPRSDH